MTLISAIKFVLFFNLGKNSFGFPFGDICDKSFVYYLVIALLTDDSISSRIYLDKIIIFI